MTTTSALSLILSAIALPVLAQTGDPLAPKPGSATVVVSGSIPRTADGKPDFSGVWDHPYVPDMSRTTKNGPLMSQEGPGKLPFTPAAQTAFDKYDPHTDGDYTGACLPFGYLRSFNAPYPIEILQNPKKIAFLFEQNTWFHIAALDRAHPKDVNPTWFGDSVAKWDGDTLVIDTIGFNGNTRLDTVGHPQAETQIATAAASPALFNVKSAGAKLASDTCAIELVPSPLATVMVAGPVATLSGIRKFTWPAETNVSGAAVFTPVESWMEIDVPISDVGHGKAR